MDKLKTMQKQNMRDSWNKLTTNDQSDTSRKQRLEVFLKKFNKLSNRKFSETRKQTLSELNRYSSKFIKTLLKIESKYGLPQNSLKTGIISLQQQAGQASLTVNPTPSSVSQKVSFKKNGYKYLSFIIRRSVLLREDLLFKFYRFHTMFMRYSILLARLLHKFWYNKA